MAKKNKIEELTSEPSAEGTRDLQEIVSLIQTPEQTPSQEETPAMNLETTTTQETTTLEPVTPSQEEQKENVIPAISPDTQEETSFASPVSPILPIFVGFASDTQREDYISKIGHGPAIRGKGEKVKPLPVALLADLISNLPSPTVTEYKVGETVAASLVKPEKTDPTQVDLWSTLLAHEIGNTFGCIAIRYPSGYGFFGTQDNASKAMSSYKTLDSWVRAKQVEQFGMQRTPERLASYLELAIEAISASRTIPSSPMVASDHVKTIARADSRTYKHRNGTKTTIKVWLANY